MGCACEDEFCDTRMKYGFSIGASKGVVAKDSMGTWALLPMSTIKSACDDLWGPIIAITLSSFRSWIAAKTSQPLSISKHHPIYMYISNNCVHACHILSVLTNLATLDTIKVTTTTQLTMSQYIHTTYYYVICPNQDLNPQLFSWGSSFSHNKGYHGTSPLVWSFSCLITMTT